MKTSEHKGLWHKHWNGTELRCCFSDPKEVNAGCVSACSNQSNHILSHPGTRSSWVNFASVWIQIFFYSCQTLFTKAFVSSVGGLQKHDPALPSHTSVVPCSLQIQSFPLSWKHLSRFQSFPPSLNCLSARFFFPYTTVPLWKRNRISISGFYWPQPSITQKDAWDPAVKTLEWCYL